MIRFARVAGRVGSLVGWLAFCVVAALFIAEKLGIVTAVVREILASEAGSMGADIRVERAVLRWFEPAVELEGVTLGPGGESIRLERARVGFELFEGPWLRVSEIELHDGHVRISPALITGIEGFATDMAARRRVADVRPHLPMVYVEGLEVDYVTRRLGTLPLGRVHLVVRTTEDGSPQLTGRLIPTLVNAADATGEVFLAGRETKPDEFEVTASAAGLRIDSENLPDGSWLDDTRAYAPRGKLAFEAHGVVRLGEEFGLEAGAAARISLSDGSIRIADGKQTCDALQLELAARYAPRDRAAGWELAAWHGGAELSGRWNTQPFEVRARIGSEAGPNALARCSLHFEKLEFDERMVQLAEESAPVRRAWDSLEPRGTAEVWGALRCPESADPLAALEIGFELGLHGDGGLTYHGWPNHANGMRDQGFPLPLEHIEGTAVYARSPARMRPFVIGLSSLVGNHGSGTIHGGGLIESHRADLPSDQPGHGYAELDLHFTTAELAVDGTFEAALRGLSGAVHPGHTWEPFHPTGGRTSVDVQIQRIAERPYAAVRAVVGLDDVALTWTDLPVPVRKARGRLEFASDGTTERGLSMTLEGELATARKLRIGVRMETDSAITSRPEGKPMDELSYVELAVERFSLTGDDKRIVVAQHPDIGHALERITPRGFVDVAYVRSKTAHGNPFAIAIEVTPREPVQINPSDFKMVTGDVRGRVLVTSREVPSSNGSSASTAGTNAAGASTPDSTTASSSSAGPNTAGSNTGTPNGAISSVEVETRLIPLIGEWGPDVQVAFTAKLPGEPLRFFGAGIDPANKGLLGSLGQAMRTPGEASDIDFTALRVEGRLDLVAEFAAAAGEHDGASKSARIFLRGGSVTSGEHVRLDGLSGVVEWRDKAIVGEKLRAFIAGTPVDISEARFATTADGYESVIRLSARDLPLDRDHLRAFLSSETVEALLGELKWRGWIDVDDAEIRLSGSPRGGDRVEFSGRITPNDMSVQLGLPISVRSASARIEHLALEGGRVRAWGRIEDLYGEIAGRNLGPANLLFTYVEPRLAIENVSGELEGGRVRPLGGDATLGGTVFSIDLEEPFPFQLALNLENVNVAGMLRGLFPSNIATKGLLNCQLRLTGNTENLLGIEGSGSILVRESRLWSVPVFRELFSQLGLDNTAIFDQMATNVRIRNGVVQMTDIAAHSPIVQLVGNGSVDFDGRLKHDLEVRYDLVDRLGPVARVLYSIQNKLLSVAIRGDMARPEVIFKGPFTSLFGRRIDRYRALPLPGFAELPPRF